MAPIMSRKLSRLAGGDVENAVDRGGVEQPAQHGDGVVDIDEIAALVAVGDACFVRFEQFDGFAGFGHVAHFGQHAHHLPLMIFVRAIDVEELQSRPMRRQIVLPDMALGHRDIEHMLAPAVEIHRLQLAQSLRRPVVGKAVAAVAVSCGRGGVDERRAGLRAPVEQAQRQAEIVLHHQVGVGGGGVGDRAHVDDGVELAAVQPIHQLGRRHQVGHPALGQIAPFGVVMAQQVVDDDIGGARLVEARDHVRPDEAGPAGDQKHDLPHCAPSFAPVRGRAQMAPPNATQMAQERVKIVAGQAVTIQGNGCQGGPKPG